MLKISPIKTMAVAAALMASTSVVAQNRLQSSNAFLTEVVNKKDKNSKDVFVQETKQVSTVNKARSNTSDNPDFDKAVSFYNDKMTSSQRYQVTRKTYTNLETRLYNMEKELDEAFKKCEAYQDIVIVPRWHYRFYPRFYDQLINFDIDDLRVRTTKDMASLHKLKDDAAYVFEKADGVQTHTEPQKTHYDVDELAEKNLGMSYREFAEKYKDELEFCKTVTYADLYKMSDSQEYVYSKAKAYAEDMLTTTVLEAHTVNWDISDKKVDETIKTTTDMYVIDDFEYDGITKKGLSEIESAMTFKAFEDALIEIYNELKTTGKSQQDDEKTAINSAQEEKPVQRRIKRIVDGVVKIFTPDGSVYNLQGQKIKK